MVCQMKNIRTQDQFKKKTRQSFAKLTLLAYKNNITIIHSEKKISARKKKEANALSDPYINTCIAKVHSLKLKNKNKEEAKRETESVSPLFFPPP